MKKIISFAALTVLAACSDVALENEQNIISDSTTLSSDEEKAFTESMGDSVLPYFDFDEDGNRTHYLSKSKDNTLKKANNRQILTLDSEKDFIKLEADYAKRIAEDTDYRKSIERPLDYVCPTSMLAMNEDYEVITLANGDTVLSNKILLENCTYIGYDCEKCDDSAEEDPYLKAPKTLKKETVENTSFDTEVTVEIYPYRMIASSFIAKNILYASAGAETYFKKRQRVWRGPFTGMVWRWADFDPDRNGVRAYCFDGCAITDKGKLACTDPESSSDLDSEGDDTEDITIRCNISFGFTLGDFEKQTMLRFKTTAEKFKGGVVGMHYVKHNDYYFKAKTSTGFSQEVKDMLHTYNGFNYR